MIPYTLLELESELSKATTAIGVHAELHAKAKSDFKKLEDFEKVILAQNTPNEGTVAAKDKAALTSKAYIEHLTALAAAREKYELALGKFTHAQAEFDKIRTIVTNKRVLIEKGIDNA